MAIILKTNDDEQDFYQKILFNESYATANGIYIGTIVFKNKIERDKDKLREPKIQLFLSNIFNMASTIKTIESAEEQNNQFILNEKAFKIAHYLPFYRYKYNHTDQEEFVFSEEEYQEAEQHGFEREWILDPVILIRKDTIRIDDYNKQDLSLESLYTIFKENIYTDANGNLLVEDDL